MEETTFPRKYSAFFLIAPFFVFALIGALEPKPSDLEPDAWIPYRFYPLIYSIKILAVSVTIFVSFLLSIRKVFPPRFTRYSLLAVVGGAVGVVLWVAVCQLGLESYFFTMETRSAFNPFEQMPSHAWLFWSLRLAGLAILVPILEEFFLRGFLLRIVVQNDWETVSIGTLNKTVWITVLAYAALTHPNEAFAAMLWFAGVTWFVHYTKNIWDAILLHAVTNLLLGLYVLQSGNWTLL